MQKSRYPVRVSALLVPVTGLDLHFLLRRKLWCHLRRAEGEQHPTGVLQLDWFSSAHNAKKQIPGSGICFFGAGDRTRTGTPSLAADFESATSTISSHRQVCPISIVHFAPKCKHKVLTTSGGFSLQLCRPCRIMKSNYFRRAALCKAFATIGNLQENGATAS